MLWSGIATPLLLMSSLALEGNCHHQRPLQLILTNQKLDKNRTLITNFNLIKLVRPLPLTGSNFTKPFPKVLMMLPGRFRLKPAGQTQNSSFKSFNFHNCYVSDTSPIRCRHSGEIRLILHYSSATNVICLTLTRSVPCLLTLVLCQLDEYFAFEPNN